MIIDRTIGSVLCVNLALCSVSSYARDIQPGSCGEMIGERLTTDFNNYGSRNHFAQFVHKIFQKAMVEVRKDDDKPSDSMVGIDRDRMTHLYGVEFALQCDYDPQRNAVDAMISSIEKVNSGDAKIDTQ